MSGAEELQRESMEFDVLIVGGGPAGLAAAIRLKQVAPDTTVCVVEKGSEIGAHILSGAVLEPRALDELLPDWRDDPPALATPAGDDRFMLLTATRAIRLPTPPAMNNHGNYVVSLGNVCRWLSAKAEALGVEVYPGFAASETLIEDNQVKGVVAGVMGIQRDGAKGPNYQPGMELRATYTLFAEGCRGSLTKQLFERYDLRAGVAPQTFALGIKELWEIPRENHKPGMVWHSVGWPLTRQTYGGSWLYMLGENLVSIGFVVGLDYPNPWLSPFDEFQRFKTHPAVAAMLKGGKRIAYGARALNEGGIQAIPKLVFPGGALIGDTAGFLNVPKIKGTHTAMKTGMLAAEACAAALAAGGAADRVPVLDRYPEALRASWVWQELSAVRNIRPGFAKFGFWGGMASAALDAYVFRGKAPWTMGHHQDHETLLDASKAPRIAYPKPDGVLTFDRLSSVFLSNTNHEEDQPAHLQLRDPGAWKGVNWDRFRSPESRYCPAAVYEAVGPEAERELRGTPDAEATGEGAVVKAGDGEARLVINAQNCVHCKTCDIKDPTQNIDWKTPEGGGGPAYIGGM